MKKMIFSLALFATLVAYAQEPKLKKIFNGKNLKGWVAPANNTWWMNYTSEKIVDEGPVGLQLHPGNEMSISYRNIRLAEL